MKEIFIFLKVLWLRLRLSREKKLLLFFFFNMKLKFNIKGLKINYAGCPIQGNNFSIYKIKNKHNMLICTLCKIIKANIIIK